jgi:hypothetical protein
MVVVFQIESVAGKRPERGIVVILPEQSELFSGGLQSEVPVGLAREFAEAHIEALSGCEPGSRILSNLDHC